MNIAVQGLDYVDGELLRFEVNFNNFKSFTIYGYFSRVGLVRAWFAEEK